MKNLVFFFVAGLFLSLLFVGCDKDIEEPVVPRPYIEASAVPAKVPVGDSILVTLNWDIQNSSVAYLDGKPLEVFKGSKELYITKNTNFVFKAKNDNGDEATKIVSAKGPVFDMPTIEITANPDTLPIGGGITTISWTSTNADSVQYNGAWYPPNGSLNLGFVSSTISFTFEVIGKGGIITSPQFEIYVLRMDDLLCSGGIEWILTQGDFLDSTGVFQWTFFQWENSPPCEQDTKMTFTMNPNLYVYNTGVECDGDLPFVVNTTWVLNYPIISFPDYPNSPVKTIVLLTKDILVITFPSVRVGGDEDIPILVRYTYKHIP